MRILMLNRDGMDMQRGIWMISLKRIFLSAFFMAAVTQGSLQAQAQSIDYASLGTLFGEPVTTSATGKPQRVSEAPVAMEIVTADDIRRSGAKDIAEVLRGLSGVNVLQSTRQQYDVNIRGYNQPYSPNLLVLVNGRQVYLDDYGYTVWATIPVQMSEIRQIEVVKGPNTALFGFNAAAGVINIVTMNPLYDKNSTLSVTGGTDNYRDASLVKTFKIGDSFGIRFSGGASKAREFNGDANGADPSNVFTPPEKTNVSLDSIYQVTQKSQFRLEASHSGVNQTEMTPYYFLTKVEHETNSIKGSYIADTPIGLVESSVYMNWLDTNFRGSIFDATKTSDVRNNVLVAQLGDTFKVGLSHTFRLQGEYRHNVADGVILGPTGSSVEDDVYSISGMWEWVINNAWNWTNSARVDRFKLSRSGPITAGSFLTNDDFDRTITEPSYNSGIVWKATNDDTFRFNTARGVRMASFFNLALSLDAGATIDPDGGGALPAFPVLQVGNPYVTPTTITNYEIGWNRKVKPINGALNVNLFATWTRDTMGGNNVICTPFAPPCNAALFVSQSGNTGSSRSVGAEIGLNGRIGTNWTWSINNTIQKIYDDYTDTTVNTKDKTPLNITNAHLGYQTGPWEADAFLYFTTSFKQEEPTADATVDPPLVRVSPHLGVSARIGYKLNRKTTIAISGQELQSSYSTTSRAPDVERRVFLSLTKDF